MKIVIVTDSNTHKLFAQELAHQLKLFQPLILSFKAGEPSKNIHTYQRLISAMLKNKCGRDTIIYALGGGVVGDMAGFVAATYMRGISYIQIPTTLLAMVDSSIGGKTGINTPEGKNLIGAFHQPVQTIIDINYLTTLSQKQFINGLVESLKMFMTSNAKQFNYAHKNINKILSRDNSIVSKVIEQSIKIKLDVVHKDEKENNLRAILNFGHTIGHAIEKVSNYKILHGYAVGMGILVEARLSQLLGLLSDQEYQVIKKLLLKLNISAKLLKKLDIHKIILATKSDKKSKSNQTRYILLKKIGQVHIANNSYTHAVPDNLVKKAFMLASEV
ncbi:MAG TPA: 3-dehydroquinate synthase [Gammaproteobacteria bacterium]|nr:3-dehydroquinate synthase [Gammaproteobacteria bacterium]